MATNDAVQEAQQSGGLLCSERVKPTERGGADRRMRSIRVNPTAKTARKPCQNVRQRPRSVRTFKYSLRVPAGTLFVCVAVTKVLLPSLLPRGVVFTAKMGSRLPILKRFR